MGNAVRQRIKGRSERPYTKSAQKEVGVLQLIHSRQTVSRVELAKHLGASAASITALIHRLIDRGLIVESGQGLALLGRKPILLRVRDDVGYVVGVDFGSFFLRVVIASMNGNIVYALQRETGLSRGREQVLREAFGMIHSAIAESGIPKGAIKGIGAGHSGVIDISRGIVLALPRPGQMLEWKNVPLRTMIEDEFGLPCVLEDSVRTRGIAEKCFGLGAGLDDFIYIDVGMGIGAAIFIDGNLYRGQGGNAGEFGHMTVDERGPLCCCGNTGCVEALASCAAIIQSARIALERGVDSKIRELAQKDLNNISIEMIGHAALENDGLAFRVLNEAVSHIAVALADVVNLLNPKVVIFGGALFRAAPELLIGAIKVSIRQRALEKSANEVEFKVSNLDTNAGALGAARLMSESLLATIYEENSSIA